MMHTEILFATDKVEKYRNAIDYLEKKDFFRLIVATDGDEVLKHLNNHVPDFAVFDVNLPILDGFQLCKIMKSAVFRQCENTPVVLLSDTYRTYMASQLAKSVGAYSILHAPFAMEDLLHLIHNKLFPDRTTPVNPPSLQDKTKVMIASDDPDIVKKFAQRLCTEGYEVLVKEDLREIIHTLEIERHRILFLDCKKVTGHEILRRIKESIPETIVVVIADRGSEFMAIELLKAGANDYIVQPFDTKSVSAICEDSFKRYDMNLVNKRLDETESRLHSMIEGMVDGVILMDAHGKIILVNSEGKELLKYLDINRTNDDSIMSLNNVSIKEIYHEIFIKKQRYVSFEIHIKRDNEKHFVVVASPLSGVEKGKAGIIIVLRDVTREYQLQNQAVKSERLYAASNLVAGAAHELNNPLAGIQLCADLVLNDPSVSEKAKKYLNRIQKEAEQIQGVIKSLLTLTGNYTLSKEQVNINELIEEIIAQKVNQFDYANIKIIKLLDEKLPRVFVDKHQMKRVFLNIVENACTSMAEVTNERCLTIQTESHNDRVKIIISDTGPGIPEEYLTKIFEPFFTAKNIKHTKGTGLGLSIAHSIIHQHNGRIYAESKLGAGAKFVVELPVTKNS
jgi:PAS domain S-box-containing protein